MTAPSDAKPVVWIIYCHTCMVTGKKYVGLTKKTMEQRWLQHVSFAKAGRRGPPAFHAAIRKHGIEDWVHDVLDVVNSLDDANASEIRCIEQLRTLSPDGYNVSKGGDSRDWPDDARQRLSVSLRRTFAAMTQEQRSERGRRTWTTSKHEKHAAFTSKRLKAAWAAMTAEEQKLRMEPLWRGGALLTREQFVERGRKASATRKRLGITSAPHAFRSFDLAILNLLRSFGTAWSMPSDLPVRSVPWAPTAVVIALEKLERRGLAQREVRKLSMKVRRDRVQRSRDVVWYRAVDATARPLDDAERGVLVELCRHRGWFDPTLTRYPRHVYRMLYRRGLADDSGGGHYRANDATRARVLTEGLRVRMPLRKRTFIANVRRIQKQMEDGVVDLGYGC